MYLSCDILQIIWQWILWMFAFKMLFVCLRVGHLGLKIQTRIIIFYVQSNLAIRSPLLSSHLFLVMS
jgi:hypothetical protein